MSFLAIPGDWRRLQRRMMRIPAETQKSRFFIGLFLVLGIILRPFERYLITFSVDKKGKISRIDGLSPAVVYQWA
jgi:hypothetical protein